MSLLNRSIVGTCGLCGGPVSVPTTWLGIVPPTPTCESCGATARQDYGPTLPMNPPPRVDVSTTSGGA